MPDNSYYVPQSVASGPNRGTGAWYFVLNMDPDNGDLRAAEDSELHDDQDAEDESRREALRQVPLKDSNQEIARKKGRVANSGQNRLKPGTHLPIEVGGTSQANGEVSKERLAVVRPQRYGTLGTLPTKGKDNGFRQRSGFSRLEFDELDDEQGGDREPLIKQVRLHTYLVEILCLVIQIMASL